MTGDPMGEIRPLVRVWELRGDHLKLVGYPIRIRRLEQNGDGNSPRFAIDIEGLPSEMRENLWRAKECGEEHANEIDEIPIPPPPKPAPKNAPRLADMEEECD